MTTITCDRCYKKQDEQPTFKPSGLFTSSMCRELKYENEDTHYCMDCARILVGRIQEWKRRAE
jgi:hypothetical protein